MQEIARIQRITSYLYFRLRTLAEFVRIPAEVLSAMAEWYQERTMRNLFLFSELRLLVNAPGGG